MAMERHSRAAPRSILLCTGSRRSGGGNNCLAEWDRHGPGTALRGGSSPSPSSGLTDGSGGAGGGAAGLPAQVCLHEFLQVAVEDGLGVADLDARPVVLDQRVGMEDVAPDLAAPLVRLVRAL